MKIDPHYQQQRYSTEIIVSGKIRVMRTFVGVRWRQASNENGVVENGDFYPALDTIGDGVLFSIELFVCLFVSKITRKRLDRFA